MSNRSNDGPEMMIGTIIIVCFFVSLIIKAIINIVTEIGKLCIEIANTAESVLMMLFRIAEVALLASIAIGSVVGAVYFTRKYISLVKRGTEIMNDCELRCQEMERKVEEHQKQLEMRVAQEVRAMRHELNAALAEPEVAPAIAAPQAMIEAQPVETIAQIENVSVTTERVSNPY